MDRLVADGHDVTVIDNESSDAHDQFYWNTAAKIRLEDWIAEYK